LSDLLREIAEVSEGCNITGVLLGSCYGGECTQTMEDGIQASNMRWCVGYASGAWWLEGTLVDCSILARMARARKSSFRSADKLISHFADAIAQFAPTYPIGADAEDEGVALQDSLQFVVQADGKGQKARNVSAEVFDGREGFSSMKTTRRMAKTSDEACRYHRAD